VLLDKDFAMDHPKMNAIVYSQLAVATVDGTAHHSIKQFEETKDGAAAWAVLVDWYDGDLIKNLE
jgi:hypothetical protein